MGLASVTLGGGARHWWLPPRGPPTGARAAWQGRPAGAHPRLGSCGQPEERRACVAAHSGAAEDVPPRVFQRARAAALYTVMAPVNSSESALTSGSWRQAVASGPALLSSRQKLVPSNVSAVVTAPELLVEAAPPGPCRAACQAGDGHDSGVRQPPSP